MEFLWTASDGLTFPGESWEPVGEARGVLFCLHGMSGAATDFHALGLPLSQAGYAVFALNIRGQGHDPLPKRRGTELDLAGIEKDVRAFAQTLVARFPRLPVFWCGESMGALLLMHLLAQPGFDLPVQGAIFSAPVVELRKKTPVLIRKVLGLVSKVIPRYRLNPKMFITEAEAVKVTRDEAFRARNRAASHFIPIFSLGFLHGMDRLMESSHALARHIMYPCLVLAAEQDVFVDSQRVAAWCESLGARDKTIHIYPEAYHCLWNDDDRELVIADILAWLAARLSSEGQYRETASLPR